MILDTLENSGLYESIHPRFKKAFDYLKNNDLVQVVEDVEEFYKHIGKILPMKTPILITLLTAQSLFGLVSIIPVEIGKEIGLSNIAEASLETKRGNTDTDNYKASYRTTYDDGKNFVTWGEASGAYGKANGNENTNKAQLNTSNLNKYIIKNYTNNYKEIHNNF